MEQKLHNAASKLPTPNLTAADIYTGTPAPKPNNLWRRAVAVAVCFILLMGVGFGTYAYAAETREYNAAMSFFGEYDLPTEGLTRKDIKAVYRDIKNKSFIYEKTADVIEDSLTPEQKIEYEASKGGSISGNVAELWGYKTQNTGSQPAVETTQPTVETTQPTQLVRPNAPVGTVQLSGLTFQVTSSHPYGYTVTRCSENATGEVVIPETVNGYPVVAIRNKAFAGLTGITNVVIPDTVEHIEPVAFDGCTGLIGTAYDNAVYLGSEKNPYLLLLKVTDKSITQFQIQPGTRFIYSEAFMRCGKLSELTIPDQVVSVGYNAFDNCTSMLYLTVGKNVSEIHANFMSCWALKRIQVAAENPYYTSDEYGALYNENMTELWSLPCNSGSAYVIPDSVTALNANAFGQYNKMASLTIGKNVNKIAADIFQFCRNLKEITVAEGNTYFETDEYGALYDIKDKESKRLIRVPVHLTGNYTVRKGTKHIGPYAFDSLFKLESIIIPESVVSLGQHFVGSISTFKTIYFGGTAAEWVDMVRSSGCTYLLNHNPYSTQNLETVFNYTETTPPTTAPTTVPTTAPTTVPTTVPTTIPQPEIQPTAPTEAAQNTARNQSGTVIAMGVAIVILALLNIVITVMLLKKKKT